MKSFLKSLLQKLAYYKNGCDNGLLGNCDKPRMAICKELQLLAQVAFMPKLLLNTISHVFQSIMK